MSNRVLRNLALILILASLIFAGSVVPSKMSAQTQTAAVQDKSRTRRVSEAELPSPSPTPPAKDDTPQESDDVVRVETNLTSIFFTAADSNKRFISSLKKEDVRVLEDGQPQEIFPFQQNIDLPLSIAILIDTSRSEERTLPDEKAAARSFVEAVMRPEK